MKKNITSGQNSLAGYKDMVDLIRINQYLNNLIESAF